MSEQEKLRKILYYSDMHPNDCQFIQDLIDNKDIEIERLSKEVDMWIRLYNEEYDVINELEKWLEEQIKISQAHGNELGVNVGNTFKNKLKELKGDSSNE